MWAMVGASSGRFIREAVMTVNFHHLSSCHVTLQRNKFMGKARSLEEETGKTCERYAVQQT